MGIRARLLWLVTVATLVPSVLVGIRFAQDRDRQIEAAVASLSTAAGSLAGDLEARVQATGQLLYGLARARDLESRDRAACSTFLSEVRNEHPQFTGILTVDPDGSLFCDSLLTGRNLDLRDRTYYKRALAGPDRLVLEATFGRLTGISVLQIAFIVRSEAAELKQILLASLNLAKFVQDHGSLQPRGLQLLLVDRRGTVLAWWPGGSAAKAPGAAIADSALFRFAVADTTARSAEIVGADGAVEVWAVAASSIAEAGGLKILAGYARDELLAGAERRFGENLQILALVSILLFGGVWVLAEIGVRRQIGRIAEMASRLGQGDLGARVAGPYPSGELGALMAVLDRTAASLQQQRAAIDDLNRRLVQSQKMEAVGQLTGGLAHDFNNLLTVILGNAEALEEELQRQPQLRHLAEMTRQAAERGAELTRSLLAFARKQPLEPKEIDVGVHVGRMDALLRRTLGEHIECHLELGRNLPAALVDPVQLESAILNLVLNARDAMPQGGRLTVETGTAHLDAAYAAQNEEVTPGDYVVVAVTDTGTGMAPEVLAQVFEPFFTTKEFGQGSGLGLSMVYGFAKQSGGHVKVYSEPGQGTTVRLYLPFAAALAAGEPAAGAAAGPGGSESVLVVEDDPLVRGHVVGELTRLGYRVFAAGDGAEALEVLRGPEHVDLLFTDVVMPGGLSGPRLAEEAARLRPGIRVLYTSGYTENAVVHHGRLDPGVALLSKPYRRQELAEKLRAVLGPAGPAS